VLHPHALATDNRASYGDRVSDCYQVYVPATAPWGGLWNDVRATGP
jgi:hypothetical protein